MMTGKKQHFCETNPNGAGDWQEQRERDNMRGMMKEIGDWKLEI